MFVFTQITEQGSQSIDEIYAPNNFGEHNTQTLSTMTSLIKLLRSNIDGPPLWACTSHFALNILTEDASDAIRLVSIRPSNDQVWISYDWVSVPPFPSGTNVTGTTTNLNEAVVMVVKAINISIDQHELNIDHLVYVHEEPEMESHSKEFCYCPHCGLCFYFTDTTAWNGRQHLFCGQRLKLPSDY